MDEIILKSLREAAELQETRINELEEQMRDIENVGAKLDGFLEQYKTIDGSIRLFSSRMAGLEGELQRVRVDARGLRQQLGAPLRQEHHHHFPKILLATIGLFFALSAALGGWFHTSRHAADYKMADVKLRFLRLQSEKPLLRWLLHVDSLATVKPDSLHEVVSREEAARRQKLELLETAIRKEEEARELRSRAMP